MVFFNKIYTYEHWTPALWFRGSIYPHYLRIVILKGPFNKVCKNPLYGNWTQANQMWKGHQLLQCYSNHKPDRWERTETDIIRGSARAIKGIPKCFFFATFIWDLADFTECALTRFLTFTCNMLQCHHVSLCLIQSSSFSGSDDTAWLLKHSTLLKVLVLLNGAPTFLNSVVVFLVVPSLLSWSWQ